MLWIFVPLPAGSIFCGYCRFSSPTSRSDFFVPAAVEFRSHLRKKLHSLTLWSLRGSTQHQRQKDVLVLSPPVLAPTTSPPEALYLPPSSVCAHPAPLQVLYLIPQVLVSSPFPRQVEYFSANCSADAASATATDASPARGVIKLVLRRQPAGIPPTAKSRSET